jgi:hypothetical protein
MIKAGSPAVKFLKTVHIGFIVVVLLLLAVIVVRLALPGIVKNYVNKKLNELPGYSGHVDDIDIHLLRGAYVIKDLHLKKKSDPEKYPFLAIHRADLSLEWGALFKGRLAGVVILDEPVVNILATEEISKEPSRESWTKTVKALIPMTINRLQVNGGSFAYRDLDKKPPTNLHIDRMQLTALNLANVEKAADPLPSQVNVTGTSIGDGHLKLAMKGMSSKSNRTSTWECS